MRPNKGGDLAGEPKGPSWLFGVFASLLAVAVVVAMLWPRISTSQHPSSTSPAGSAAVPPAQATSQPLGAPIQTPTGFFSGWFVSDTTGWIVSSGAGHGVVQKTSDGGAHWTNQLDLPFPRAFERDMKFLDDRTGFVVTLTNVGGTAVPQLMKTVDGTSWSQATLPVGTGVAGIDFISTTTGWVLEHTGTNGELAIFRTADGAATWAKVADSTSAGSGLDPNTHLEGIRFADDRRGWIGGWRGAASLGQVGPFGSPLLYQTSDGGKTWSEQALPQVAGVPFPCQVLWVDTPRSFADGTLAAAATVGPKQTERTVTYISHDGGRTWTGSALPIGSRTWAPSDSVHVIGGVDGTALAATTSGPPSVSNLGQLPPGWRFYSQQWPTATTAFAVAVDPAGGQQLVRSTDGGRSWVPLKALS